MVAYSIRQIQKQSNQIWQRCKSREILIRNYHHAGIWLQTSTGHSMKENVTAELYDADA